MTERSEGNLTISIAMATYNGEAFIEQQLSSIAEQTYAPSELVISDDGSSDRTVNILTAFAHEAPWPVRIQRRASRLGYSENFIHTVSRCQCEIVALADQDDVWMPNKVDRCVQEFRAAPHVALVHHASAVIAPSGVRTDETLGPARTRVVPHLQVRTYVAPLGHALVFKRRLATGANSARRPQSRMGGGLMTHDEWIHFLGFCAGPVAELAEPLVLHRRHDANTSIVRRDGLGARIGRVDPQRHRDQLRYASSCDQENAEFVASMMRAEDTADIAGPLGEASVFFRARSELLASRAALSSLGRGRRTAGVVRLLLKGAYRVGAPLGPRALMRDMAGMIERRVEDEPDE